MHITYNHNITMVTCNSCLKEFTNASSLKRHLLNKKPCEKNIILLPEELNNSIVVAPHTVSDTKLNVIDLFCGCGGMSKGLTDAGMHIIGGIDVWDKAIESDKNIESGLHVIKTLSP